MMQFMQNGTINLVEYMAENNRNLAKDIKDLDVYQYTHSFAIGKAQ